MKVYVVTGDPREFPEQPQVLGVFLRIDAALDVFLREFKKYNVGDTEDEEHG